MYKRILIALENSPTDQAILAHIRPLARMSGAKLILVHVADGWVARNFDRFQLAPSEEMKEDQAFLDREAVMLRDEGFDVEPILALGEPADEIVRLAESEDVDLIAMSTHGHRFIADFFLGSTSRRVRHRVDVPVLLLKAR